MKVDFSNVTLIVAVILTAWNMMLATVASNSPLFKRLEINQNIASGSLDKIKAITDEFPDLKAACLYEAIRQDKFDVLKLLMKDFNGHQGNEPSNSILNIEYEGMQLLSVAIIHRHESMVEWMVENGASVKVSDASTQKTPLHYAFEFGIESMVQLLIKHGANTTAKDSSNMTCLHYACISGDLDVVSVAISLNMGLNVIDSNGETPLHYACKSGNEAIVNSLIKHGASVDSINQLNMTPLHYACKSGNEATVNMLIKHGADVNAICSSNNTPLHYACESGSKAWVRMLIKHGANVNAIGYLKKTPLHCACKLGNEIIACVLIEHNADMNALGPCGLTPLHYACESGSEACVRMLIKHGADVNAICSSKKTPLHYACESGSEACVRILIEHGGEVIKEANGYMDQLHNVVQSGNVIYVRYLFEHAERLNIDNSMFTGASLLNVLKKEYYEIAKLLIEYGANFSSAKSEWIKSGSKRKVELFLSNMHLFSQLNGTEKNNVLATSTYDNMLDINLPDHVIGSRLGCIFMLFSQHSLKNIRKDCEQQNIGYLKFMFVRARLFLQQKQSCNDQDPESVSILKCVFGVIFKNADFETMSTKLITSCELLTGPSGFLHDKENYQEAQEWTKRYLNYPWAFREAIQTNAKLAAAMLNVSTSIIPL